MTTYLRIDDDGRYRACELVDGRRTRDLRVPPFETARDACLFVAIHDRRFDVAAAVEALETAETGNLAASVPPPEREEAAETGNCAPSEEDSEPPRDRVAHEHVFVRRVRFGDLVMTDGKAARTWMRCIGCQERREIVS
jgi:hypothetical protein